MEEIQRAIKGDQKALEQILLANAAYLERTAYLYLSRDEEVQDVLSETTLAAIRSIKTLKEPKYFRTWLTKLLIRQCFRRYAQQRVEPILVADLPDVPVAGGDLTSEQKLDLLAGLRQLNDANRQVLLMHYYHGLTIWEIAQLTQLSPNTIKSQLLRGKQQLKQWLGDDYFAN